MRMSMALKDRAGPARDKLIAFGTEMYSRGLDKGDELEADRLGIVIAARAGYDAYGLPSVLQTLQAMSAQDSAIALMFKTHPAPGERLDALGEKMQPVLDAYSAQPQLADRFSETNQEITSRQGAPGRLAADAVAKRHALAPGREEAQVGEPHAGRALAHAVERRQGGEPAEESERLGSSTPRGSCRPAFRRSGGASPTPPGPAAGKARRRAR